MNPLTAFTFHNIFFSEADEKIKSESAEKIVRFFFIIIWIFSISNFFFGIELSNQIRLESAYGNTVQLIERGQSFRKGGDFENAVEMFDRALSFARESGDQTQILHCLSSLAILHWNMGRLQKSSELYDQALRLSKTNSHGDPEGWPGKALRIYDEYLKAKEKRQFGHYRESIAHFKTAIDLARAMNSPEHELKCLRQMSLNYLELEELPIFYQLNISALEIAKRINHKIEEGRCLNNIGLYFSKLNSYSKALAYFEEALDLIRATIPGSENESDCLNNIGIVCRNIGNYDRAIKYLMESIEIDNVLENYINVSIGLNNLGSIFRIRGELFLNRNDFEKSLDNYDKAIEFIKKTGNLGQEIDTLNNIGLVHLTLGNCASSIWYFKKALNKACSSKNLPAIRNIYCNLGNVHFQLKKYTQAQQLFYKSIEMASKTESNDTLWEAYFGLGQCLEQEHQNNAALECYLKSLDIIELMGSKLSLDDQKAGFVRDKLKVYEAAINLMFRLGRTSKGINYDTEIFHVIERAKARGLLEDLHRGRYFYPDSRVSKFQQEQESVSRRISSTISELANPELPQEKRTGLLARLEKEEEESGSLLNKIKTLQIEASDQGIPEIISVEKIKSQILSPKSALLEFFLGERQSYAFLITQGAFRIQILPPRNEIENSLRAYLKLVASFPSGENLGLLAAKRIYENLIYPFEVELHSIEHLIVIPDGILSYLPFETLIGNQDEFGLGPRFLIEKFKISYAPSSSSLSYLIKRPPKKSTSKKLLAFGNPVYLAGPNRKGGKSVEEALREIYLNSGFDFSPLPYSKNEILEICRYFKKDEVDFYLNEEAKEEVVKTNPLTDYQIVHFACHGFYDEKIPLRSALVLTLDDNVEEDGFLQGREIYGLALNADLVVLSACHTGKGRLESGEGVLGLPRVFFNAGARSIISSLWKVNDKSTSKLMKYFYQYLSDGNDKAQSLRLAKLQMLKSRYSHPFFWAGFILNGDFRQISRL